MMSTFEPGCKNVSSAKYYAGYLLYMHERWWGGAGILNPSYFNTKEQQFPCKWQTSVETVFYSDRAFRWADVPQPWGCTRTMPNMKVD